MIFFLFVCFIQITFSCLDVRLAFFFPNDNALVYSSLILNTAFSRRASLEVALSFSYFLSAAKEI